MRRDDQLVALDHILQLAQVAHVVDLPAELEAAAKTQRGAHPSIRPSIHLLLPTQGGEGYVTDELSVHPGAHTDGNATLSTV